MKKYFLAIILISAWVSQPGMAGLSPAPAPDINVATRDGNFKLSDYQGQVVYLDFWASWCIPCRKSFPWMQKIQQKYRDLGLKVIAVNLDKQRKLADVFLKNFNVDFTIGFDPVGDSARAYQLKGMPSSYLIGRDGKLYASHIGFRAKETAKLEQAIKALLKQEPVQ